MPNSYKLAAAAALAFTAFAADIGAQVARPQFGALLGANFSTITDSDFPIFGEEGASARIDAKRRAGFSVGAYVTVPVSGAWSIQPELHYVQKGTKFEFDVNDPTASLDGNIALKLAYLEAPVLLRFDASTGTGIRPFIVAGPAFGLRVGCKLGIDAEEFSADTDCDSPDEETGEADDPIKKFDVGGVIGAGVAGTFSGRTVSAQVRYSRGFVTIARDADDVTPKNTGISILFGIGF